jgi:tRNA(Ile)-lysidine synthase
MAGQDRSARRLSAPTHLGDHATLATHPHVAALLGRCTFPPAGTAVVCAVSGGPDSAALLVLACAAGCAASAVHVDHGLRPSSADEAAVVGRLADRLGVGSSSRRVTVDDGPNLESRARAARFAVLPPDVLTGHTLDDQAETVLVNLLRGAGATGLAGMRSAGHPLLAVRRAETHALCTALGIEVVTDPSNADPRHLRNRVRAELLPQLDGLARRDVAAVLARQADVLRADDDLLDELAGALDPADAGALTAAPAPLARRAVRAWLRGEHPPDAATVERVLAVARGEAVACEVGGGRRVARRLGRLRLVDANPPDVDNKPSA